MARAPKLPPKRLYTRRMTASVLSASISTVKLLEKEGRLTVIRLRVAGGKVRHLAAQVDALAKMSTDSTA